jgi:hypothetical protein
MKLLNVFAGVIMTVLIVGCGSQSKEELIVGDWKMDKHDGNSPATVTCIKFNEDGTARFYYEDEALTTLMDTYGTGEGTWRVDGEKLHVEQNTMNPIDYDIVKVDENSLHLESHGTFGALSEYMKK